MGRASGKVEGCLVRSRVWPSVGRRALAKPRAGPTRGLRRHDTVVTCITYALIT